MTKDTATAEAPVLGAFDRFARALCHDDGKAADETNEAPEPLPGTLAVFRRSFVNPPEWFVGTFRAFYAGYTYGSADSVNEPADPARTVDYCVVCNSTGLEDRNIYEGDTLGIHTQSTADSGQVVIASVDDHAPIIRAASVTEKGLLLYASGNYDPIFVPNADRERVTIYGRVVQVTRTFN